MTYSIGLVVRAHKREQDLLKALKEAAMASGAIHAIRKRMEINQHLEAKHMGCIVSARLHAVGCGGMKIIGWVRGRKSSME